MSDTASARRERRLLQAAVSICVLVPILGGAVGVLYGPAMVGIGTGPAFADSHFRYLSGLLLGIGLGFLSTVPSIEIRSGRFRLLAAIVFLGGPGRLFSIAFDGARDVAQGHLPALIVEGVDDAEPAREGFGEIRAVGALGTLLGVLGLLLLAFVGWRLLAIRRAHNAAIGKVGWRLGPWPTNPAHVTTREDLIRAFEYVSLLRLGPNARHWNHREIAAALGVENDRRYDGRYEAAEQLASLYEQARYAPPEEALSDAALAAARRNLCFLAGVSAA